MIRLAAIGLLGAAAQAQAVASLQRDALDARVAAVRSALQQLDGAPVDPGIAPRLVAQWNNWKNWNNWNNWNNWGNWLNK